MLANQDDLALIMTTEQGKPLAEARGEIVYARLASSSGSPKRPGASTATPSRPPAATGASS